MYLLLWYISKNTLQYADVLSIGWFTSTPCRNRHLYLWDMLNFIVFFLNSKFDLGHLMSLNTLKYPYLDPISGHVLSL